jgi:hypothetical protein
MNIEAESSEERLSKNIAISINDHKGASTAAGPIQQQGDGKFSKLK